MFKKCCRQFIREEAVETPGGSKKGLKLAGTSTSLAQRSRGGKWSPSHNIRLSYHHIITSPYVSFVNLKINVFMGLCFGLM